MRATGAAAEAVDTLMEMTLLERLQLNAWLPMRSLEGSICR